MNAAPQGRLGIDRCEVYLRARNAFESGMGKCITNKRSTKKEKIKVMLTETEKRKKKRGRERIEICNIIQRWI